MAFRYRSYFPSSWYININGFPGDKACRYVWHSHCKYVYHVNYAFVIQLVEWVLVPSTFISQVDVVLSIVFMLMVILLITEPPVLPGHISTNIKLDLYLWRQLDKQLLLHLVWTCLGLLHDSRYYILLLYNVFILYCTLM